MTELRQGRAVVFDLFHTLVDTEHLRPDGFDSLATIAEICGVERRPLRIFAAFIPLLEVRPDAQRLGIGSELVNRMLALLRTYYSIDLVCDDDVAPFYERLGGTRLPGVAWRNPACL